MYLNGELYDIYSRWSVLNQTSTSLYLERKTYETFRYVEFNTLLKRFNNIVKTIHSTIHPIDSY